MHYGFSASFVIIGLLVILATMNVGNFNGFEVSQIGSVAGSFLFTAGIFSIYFELRGKQAIAEFVWGEAKVAYEIKESGIIEYTDDAATVNLSSEIKRAREIIAVATYSSRFLKRYEAELTECLRNSGTVTLVMQAKDSPTITAMKELNWDKEDISANFSANKTIAERLRGNGDFKLLYHRGVRAYSCILIDGNAHLSLATNSNGRSKVPRIRVEKSGALATFISRDCKRVVEQCEENDVVE